ncbi:MAG: MarC family protein [Lentisphaeraceae bacterium]|nr:MarC family protein [Lentisphaeraceae bacterium]
MNEEIQLLIKSSLALTALLNPLSVTPIFLSITDSKKVEEFKPIAFKATCTVGAVLAISIFLGEHILTFFGISINSFKMAGGIIIFLMALSMVNAKSPKSKVTASEITEAEDNNDDDISIVPLGFPLLAGPGTISTVIIYSATFNSLWSKPIFVVYCLILCYFIYISLSFSQTIMNKLGNTGINVVSRVMGILLAAMAVEMIVKAIKDLF